MANFVCIKYINDTVEYLNIDLIKNVLYDPVKDVTKVWYAGEGEQCHKLSGDIARCLIFGDRKSAFAKSIMEYGEANV